jgi:hypothetical protein
MAKAKLGSGARFASLNRSRRQDRRRKANLYHLSIDLGFMLAGGNRPGQGTAARLRAIAQSLWQFAEEIEQ